MSSSNPASSAGSSDSRSKVTSLNEALQFMERALSLIDKADAPDDIGAHLDLAIIRLKECIESNR